jgi:hypothetical protein
MQPLLFEAHYVVSIGFCGSRYYISRDVKDRKWINERAVLCALQLYSLIARIKYWMKDNCRITKV